MSAELTALAATGASTLVGLMVTDGWARAKGRLAAFLARRGGPGEAEAVERELAEAAGELVAAREAEDRPLAEDIEAGWRLRLRRLLREDPEAAAHLRALLAELTAEAGAEPGGSVVHNSISGGEVHGSVFQGRDFTEVTLNLGDAGPGGRPRA
jgi:plasmid stabilization system protein ParE